MKNYLLFVSLAVMLQSCAPGRWVGGNAKHFDQRAKKAQIIIHIKKRQTL